MTMRLDVAEERARIESEARRLARSGEHDRWWSIKVALLAQQRFTQVHRVFKNPWTCSELDRLCQQAKLRCHQSYCDGIHRHRGGEWRMCWARRRQRGLRWLEHRRGGTSLGS